MGVVPDPERRRVVMGWVRGRFTLDGDTAYDGVHDPSERWNGFACPLLTVDGVRALAAYYAAGAAADYDEWVTVQETGDGGMIVLMSHVDEGDAVVPPSSVRVGDGWVTCYDIGSRGWVWVEASE